MQKILFLDIETDGLDATKIHICVCKDRDTGTISYHTRANTFNKLIIEYIHINIYICNYAFMF